MEFFKGLIKSLICFAGILGVGYFTGGLACVLYGDMSLDEMPDWFWVSAVAVAVCLSVAIFAGIREGLAMRWEREEARRLGYVRIVNGKVVYWK